MRTKLLLICLLSMTLQVLAKPVSPEQAIEIASEYAGIAKTTDRLKSPLKHPCQILYTRQPREGSQAYYYAVGREKQPGFILVGGDDMLPKVLGYSDAGVFSTSSMSPAMKGMLENWDAQIEYLLSHPETALSTTARRVAPSREYSLGSDSTL